MLNIAYDAFFLTQTLMGMRIFCKWHRKWMTFRPPWPTSPGFRPKLLDGSIPLKLLLKTGYNPKSFDTLDDMLGFWVQKLWSKAGLLKWWTMVRIRTFGWRQPDLASLSKVYSIPRSFYPKILHFWSYF